MEFLTILWTNFIAGHTHDKTPQEDKFDIKEHETLHDAVVYLVKNGANYQNQEIVKKVDWLPNGSQPQLSQEKPKNDDPGPPSGVLKDAPADQPQVLDFTKPANTPSNPGKRRSIFDGVLPPQLIPMVMSDSD